MPNGPIQVRVFTSRARVPITNAAVTVTVESGNSEALIGVRTTNREGLTNQVVVETPPSSNSRSPFQDKGFTTCNIRVEHENYYKILIQDAQVFPDIMTIQDVEMIPLPENSKESERLKTIVIPAQNL